MTIQKYRRQIPDKHHQLPFTCWEHERNILPLYETVWKSYGMVDRYITPVTNGKNLLKRLGFFNKNRKLLWRLTHQEANTIAERMPGNDGLRRAYFVEIRRVLPMLGLHRRSGGKLIGPYLIPALADAIRALACVIASLDSGHSRITRGGFAEIVPYTYQFTPTEPVPWFQNKYDQAIMDAVEPEARTLSLYQAQHLIERFIDEYIRLSRSIDWSKDIENHFNGWWCPTPIHDFLLSLRAIVEWLPEIEWFSGSALSMRGWKSLMTLWKCWQARNDYELDYDTVKNVSFWECEVANHYAEWSAALPKNLTYRLVPLTSDEEVCEEPSAMFNIARSYWEMCAARGEDRIFSIRELTSGKHVAIAVISRNDDLDTWRGTDIMGNDDSTLDFRKLENPISAMLQISTLVDAAATWYNRKSKPKKMSLSFQYVATLGQDAQITEGIGIRNVYCLTIRRFSLQDNERKFAELCFSQNVILLGPGRAGPWPDCRESLRANGWSARKIGEIKRFAEDVKQGDLVILRNDSGITFGLGEVVGDYEWLAEFDDVEGWDMQHARRVCWLDKRI